MHHDQYSCTRVEHLNTPYTQPGRCLYTTVRELVENSLDAAESIKQLPSLEVTMYANDAGCDGAGNGIHNTPITNSEEISQERLNKLRGVANVKRVDQTLYGDYESEDARKVVYTYAVQISPTLWGVLVYTTYTLIIVAVTASHTHTLTNTHTLRNGKPRRPRRWKSWKNK